MPLDRATSDFLDSMNLAEAPALTSMTPAEARAMSAGLVDLYGPGPDMESVRDERIATADGESIALRILTPTAAPRAVVVYLHGGGWVLGQIPEFDALGREMAKDLNATVVLVEYRLAPEYPYPTAALDAWDALTWTADRLEDIAGGAVPLVVAGDSAGGNLAAVVALRAAAEGGPDLAAQVLIYPVTDADLDNGSYSDPENQLWLDRDTMAWYWDHYVPDLADRAQPDASPLRAEDVSGVCPAIVLTAEMDVLREEGEEYAARLQSAGVPVWHRRFDGQMHGFFTMVHLLPGSGAGLAYIHERLDELL